MKFETIRLNSRASSRNNQLRRRRRRGNMNNTTKTTTMPFQLFLEKMRQPTAAELVSGIKQFINTFTIDNDQNNNRNITTPINNKNKNNNNNKNSNNNNNHYYSEKVQKFLRLYEEKFRRHSLWRNATAEDIEASVEGLEKYVCTKLYNTLFDCYKEEDDAINEQLERRVESLRNLPLTPEMLDVSRKQFLLLGEENNGEEGKGKDLLEDEVVAVEKNERDSHNNSNKDDDDDENDETNKNGNKTANNNNNTIPKSLRLASMELEKMSTYKAPRDKMNCILNACRIISNAVMRFSGGADAFVPSLIYSLAHANVKNLWKNIKYIERFRMRDRLEQGEAAYFFINIESGARFLGTCSKEQLNIFCDDDDDSFPEPVDGLKLEKDDFGGGGNEEEEKEEEGLLTTTPPFNGFISAVVKTSNHNHKSAFMRNDDDDDDDDCNYNNVESLEAFGATSLSLLQGVNDDNNNNNEREYPYYDAVVENLTIGDIKPLLMRYKNMCNKYEALKCGVELKLLRQRGEEEEEERNRRLQKKKNKEEEVLELPPPPQKLTTTTTTTSLLD